MMNEEAGTIFDSMDQLHHLLSTTKTPSKLVYSVDRLKQVTVGLDNEEYSSIGLLNIIRTVQAGIPSEAMVKKLAACAFHVHFGVEKIRRRLHEFINVTRANFSWYPLPTPPFVRKGPIEKVFRFFGFTTGLGEGGEQEIITLEQLETTCSAAYFFLIKIAKHNNRGTCVEQYARRLAAAGKTNLVNQRLFSWLVNTIASYNEFDEWMQPGALVSSSMACAGAILISKLDSIHPKYTDIMSIVLEGMTSGSFATYQLMSEVVNADTIDLDQLTSACDSPQWNRMTELINERHEELNMSPCWYKISPIILPNVKCDFSLSANPVVALTCIKLLKTIRPDTESCFANLTIPCSQEDEEEADLASKQYMASRSLKAANTADK